MENKKFFHSSDKVMDQGSTLVYLPDDAPLAPPADVPDIIRIVTCFTTIWHNHQRNARRDHMGSLQLVVTTDLLDSSLPWGGTDSLNDTIDNESSNKSEPAFRATASIHKVLQ